MSAPEPLAPTEAASSREANVREVLRLSELYLDGMVKQALALDAKGVSLTSILVTASLGLFAAASTLLLAPQTSQRTTVLGAAALATGIGLVGALLSTIAAIHPRDLYPPGSYLRAWNSPDDLAGNLTEALLEQARIYQEEIDDNQRRLDRATDHIYRALKLILFALIAGLVVGGVTLYLTSWDGSPARLERAGVSSRSAAVFSASPASRSPS